MGWVCKGCGSDVIYEVSLVPRHMRVADPEPGVEYLEYDEADDEAFWESEANIAFGCDTPDCKFTASQYGILHVDGAWTVNAGPPLADILIEESP